MKVWNDNWISCSQQLCPMGPPREEDCDMVVSDLMFPASTVWNLEKIKQCLPQHEDLIKRIVPSDCGMADSLAWLPDKTGCYTTKTGYTLEKINVEGNRSNFKWQKCVWNVKCATKIKNFLWKLSSNAIAVGENLLRRGIKIDGKCKRCGELETAIHVTFLCPFARKVWEAVPAVNLPEHRTTTSMEGLLLECTKMINLPPTGLIMPLYPWLLWVLWTSRNQLVFENKSFSETEVIGKAMKHAKEW